MRIQVNYATLLLTILCVNLCHTLATYLWSLYRRRLKRRLVKTPMSEQEEAACCLQMGEEPPVATVRRTWADYFRLLSNDGGSQRERIFYKHYKRWVPLRWQYISTEGGRLDMLPHWLECLLALWHSTRFRFFLLYFCLLMSSHLWLPALGLTVPDSEGTYISLGFLDGFMGDEPAHQSKLRACLAPAAAEEDSLSEYCFLESSELSTLSIASIGLRDRPPLRDPVTMYSDQNASRYYRLNVMNRLDGRSLHIVSESALLGVLDEIRERDPRSCICALFLGIVDALHFQRDGQSWRLMLDAQIERNNSFAEMIYSNVVYKKESPFATVNSNLMRRAIESDSLHYDSFTVAYTTLAEQTANVTVLAAVQESLEAGRRALFVETGDAERMPLTGEDAICFVHCQKLNKIMLTYWRYLL